MGFGMCNCCSLKQLRRNLAPDERVVLRQDNGGVGVFIIKKGETCDTSLDANGNHGPQFRAWYMELTETCAC